MTQPALSIVPNDPPVILPAKAVLKQYAAHLKSQSWCIDASGTSVMAFHAGSDYPANLEYFKLKFPAWSKANGIRVEATEYTAFLDRLRSDLPPLLPCILGSSFRPSDEKFFDYNGATFANTYLPFNPPRPADCSAPLADQLFERLFPDDKERTTVRQFLADTIQKPLERPQWGLLITGEGGEGKSLMMQLLEAALGNNHWWRERNAEAALKQFSEVLPDNLSVCFDDGKFGPDPAEQLKHPITSRYQVVELKGVQKTVRREVYARLIILSNKPRPLRLIEDRRWYAPTRCLNRISKEESKIFGAQVATWLRQPGTAATLFHYFMDVDLTGFDIGGCELTETHQRMSEASVSVLEKYVSEYIEEGVIFHESQLLNHLMAQGMRYVRPDELKLKLTDLGYEHVRRPPATGAKKEWLWQPVTQQRQRSLTLAESAAIVDAMARAL
jgi:hypothetical protein